MTVGQNSLAVRSGLCLGGPNQNSVTWIATEVQEKNLLCVLNRLFFFLKKGLKKVL